jgi:hypothetical protein
MGFSCDKLYYILEHPILDKLLQEELVQHLEWGVKWELARVIQSRHGDELFLNNLYDEINYWGFGDVDEVNPTASGVEELRRMIRAISKDPDAELDQIGSCQEQEVGIDSYRRFEFPSHSLQEPWSWLDRERGLSAEERLLNAQCGRVHFQAHLECDEGRYQIVLDRPFLGESHRMLQQYGSESAVTISIRNQKKIKSLKTFFRSKRFILFGRHFGMASIRGNSIILFNDPNAPTESTVNAVFDFGNWHRSLLGNQDQTETERKASSDLSPSTLPSTQPEPSQIKFVGEIGQQSNIVQSSSFDQLSSDEEEPPANPLVKDDCSNVNILPPSDDNASDEPTIQLHTSQDVLCQPGQRLERLSDCKIVARRYMVLHWDPPRATSTPRFQPLPMGLRTSPSIIPMHLNVLRHHVSIFPMFQITREAYEYSRTGGLGMSQWLPSLMSRPSLLGAVHWYSHITSDSACKWHVPYRFPL